MLDVRLTEGLGACEVFDISNPVARAPGKANLLTFAFKCRRCQSQKRRINPFKCMNVHDCVEATFNLRRNHRYDPALCADVERGRHRTEGVL